MPYFDDLPENAGPPAIFKKYPEVYAAFSGMSQALMNGPSPLSPAEREVILAFAAGSMGCQFVLTGHSEAAYAWGVPRGTLDALLQDIDTTQIDDNLKPVLHYVRKLAIQPNDVTKADADAVLALWPPQALHDAAAITGRAAYMHRLVAGIGLNPLDPEVARTHAKKRVEKGYVNLYRAFRKPD